MKKLITMMLLLAATIGFYSCSSDDGDITPPPGGEAVTPPVSYDAGWSGNFENGTANFVFERYDYGYDDEEEDVKSDFYSFDFKEGVCTDAKYCIEFYDSKTAKFYATLILSGELFDDSYYEDEEDDEYYYEEDDEDYYYNYENSLKALKKIKEIAVSAKTRAGYSDMGMTVYLTKNIIYIPLDNYKGKMADDIRNGISNFETTTEDFLYGEYDSAKGEYFCDNVRGIISNGKTIQYKVNMTFTPERYIKTYVTTVTMPNQSWAMALYDTWRGDVESIGQMFGVSPTLNMDGNVITLKAITRYDITNPELAQYAQDVTEEQILKVLRFIDRNNGTPMLRIFAE